MINNFERFNMEMTTINNRYKGSVIDVNMSMLNIQMSALPSLNYFPENWEVIQENFFALKKESMEWANSVLYKLDSVPDTILGLDPEIQSYISRAKEITEHLIKEPSSSARQKVLLTTLGRLMARLERVQKLISSVQIAIANFQVSLGHMIELLEILLNETKQSVDYDEQIIVSLKTQIIELQKEINSANKSALESVGIASQTAIAGSVVAAYGGIPGKIAGIVFFGVSLFFGNKAMKKSLEVIKKKGMVDLNEQSVDKHTEDVATLTVFLEQLKDALRSTQSAQDSLWYISQQWEGLEDSVTRVYVLTERAGKEAVETYYSSTFFYLEKVENEWNEVSDKVEGLKIEISISDAPLELGMSEPKVIDMVGCSTVVSNVEYFNLTAV